MTRPRLEEAARAVLAYLDELDQTSVLAPRLRLLRDALRAALALPPDGGEVVARAVKIIGENCFVTKGGCEDIAHALHAAGLLVGTWPDRDVIAQTAREAYQRSTWTAARGDSTSMDHWYVVADAILREMGR